MNTGHVDSSFAVGFEILKPDDTVYASGTTAVASLAAGLSRKVSFATLTLDRPGTYTVRAYTVLGDDADADNDVLVGWLEVLGPTGARSWRLYR